ncbi:MAG: 50S ribosomal protein L32 [Candidatus Anaerobiospirillum pullicola]|uniref:Large ribosomal subunit protein bL32 n=1 Tax=Candidatus Anaerobiospirillum pullicola TaxID=2838451 RepID=A0A948TFB8_9GAMM|nr:50S ribosomal protein L32 [Candidatus Anaerobiospirillum pullicola]
MAVPQNHQSRSRRDKRRTHDALSARQLATDPQTNEVHIRHHMTKSGFYRGVKYIDIK